MVTATPTPRACEEGGALIGSKLSERAFVRRISVLIADMVGWQERESAHKGGLLLTSKLTHIWGLRGPHLVGGSSEPSKRLQRRSGGPGGRP